MDIVQIPVLSDNYVYLLREPRQGLVAVVDPAEAEPVLAELARRSWRLTYILNTHHHGDHVGGNRRLVKETGCRVVGPRADQDRIPLIDETLGEGDTFAFGATEAKIFDVPGHTRGHIAYWFAAEAALFSGDVLFALGCGRLFEGTPQQMWTSLGKLMALPPATQIYGAHEYTEANLRFALSVDGDNATLRERGAKIQALRARGLPTVPSSIGEELATNPFLRAGNAQHFGELRSLKDGFR